jgi:D-3-phosphoglycerate dehydrogenase
MNLGRREKLGEAMVILSLDSPVPANVQEEVRLDPEATFVKALHMPAVKCSRGCGCGL